MEELRVEIDAETRSALREALEDMINPITIDVFIDRKIPECNEALKLVRIFEEASPIRGGKKLINFKVYFKDKDLEEFKRLGITRVPTFCLVDCKVQFVGLPVGEELRSIVETIIRVSRGESGLDKDTISIIASVKNRIVIDVIVTPPCPYCPYASLLANMFAYESWRVGKGNIISRVIEAFENPDIADKYGVTTVPAIAINGKLVFVGVPYEEELAKRIKDIDEGREVSLEVIPPGETYS